ncbi:MAG: DUF362 domain-containing protein [Eubacteriales bacterium]|nr:DUF362 domain-containing protein [Eubacteriales bacterium]
MSTIIALQDRDLAFDMFLKNLGNMNLTERLRRSDKIIIKPNLTGGSYLSESSGAITSKDLVERLIGYVTRISPNAEVFILESDSINSDHAYLKFERQNYGELVERYSQVRLYDATRNALRDIPFQGFHFKKAIRLAEIFDTPFFFISLAKVKTHGKAVYTGVLKNQFGCFFPMDKSAYHTKMGKVISDINSFIRPDLSILEMSPAMEGNGPLYGEKVDVGLIFMSDNPLALDLLLAKKTGLNRYNIRYLKFCKASMKNIYSIQADTIVNEDLLNLIPKFKYIPLWNRLIIKTGIIIQKIGWIIEIVGKKIQTMGGKRHESKTEAK